MKVFSTVATSLLFQSSCICFLLFLFEWIVILMCRTCLNGLPKIFGHSESFPYTHREKKKYPKKINMMKLIGVIQIYYKYAWYKNIINRINDSMFVIAQKNYGYINELLIEIAERAFSNQLWVLYSLLHCIWMNFVMHKQSWTMY